MEKVYADMTAAELCEAAPPLDTVKDKLYERGAGSSGRCPREGSVLLEANIGGVVIVNTTCHSWRCVGCRDRNRYRFRKMVEAGVSDLVRSLFITITYKAGTARLEDAECVSKDWRELWRRVKRQEPKLWGLPMLRVMELTKRGTPHFHVLIGNLPEDLSPRCYGNSFDGKAYERRFDDCLCVSHRLGRVWKDVQDGESWIVHVVPVSSARGAGKYLGKYLDKEFDGDRMKYLGMARRWSVTRNWPKEKRPRLVQTEGLGWARHIWTAGQIAEMSELEAGFGLLAKLRRISPKQKKELQRIMIKKYKGMVSGK